MTTSDGGVIGVKQIFGNSPARHSFNVVLLAEGFTKTQQGKFDLAAANFRSALLATKPFDRLSAGINIYKINVWSEEEGADDPANGVFRKTYFDAAFNGGGLQRLLVCNTTTALKTAVAHVPEVDLTVMVVNTRPDQFGGSGGPVAVYSLAPNAVEIALHEAGHTAFALADEYDSEHDVSTPHPAFEPSAVNVTTRQKLGPFTQLANQQTLKWKWAWTPGTALPTTGPASNCRWNSAPSPVPAGTVGSFSGGNRHNCGIYRPEYDCKMRHLGQPFCKVCQQQISDRIVSLTQLRARIRTPITAVARDSNHLDVFAVAGDGRTMNNWWDPYQGWSGWSQISGGIASAGGNGSPVTALTRYGTEISTYTVGTDGGVAINVWNPLSGWQGWGRIDGVTARFGATVTPLARFSEHIDLFTTTADGRVMSTWWEPSSPGWSPWFQITNGAVSPGSPVSAIARHANVVDLFTVGSDNRVWSAVWQPIVGWSSWFWVGDLVCRAGSTVTAISRSSDRIDLFATAPDGTIKTASWEPFTGWSGWTGVSGGVASPGAPVTVLSRRPDRMELFVLGTDHRVYTTQWNGAGWTGWADVNNGQGQRGGHVAAVSRQPDVVDLVVVGSDGVLWTTSRRDGFGWANWTQLTVT